MSNFAIMRCQKLKTLGGVRNSLRHNFRDGETPNADPERTPDNEHLSARSTDEAMGKLRDRLPTNMIQPNGRKIRIDAVLAIEYLMTTSPEWAESNSEGAGVEFFEKAIEWLEEKYGAENVITATIQYDEKTPHLSAFVVPITEDGRLSAKEFIGGSKYTLTQDQDTFAEKVQHLGLDRGSRGSSANHQTMKRFYDRFAVGESDHPDQGFIDALRPKLNGEVHEMPADVAKRVHAEYYNPLQKTLRAQAAEIEDLKRQVKEASLDLPKGATKPIAQRTAQRVIDTLAKQNKLHPNYQEPGRRSGKTKSKGGGNGPDLGIRGLLPDDEQEYDR
jgi:hypothetical protein